MASAGGKAGCCRQGKVKSQELVVFTRQLATMMDAGLPLVQTLTALEEQTDNLIFKPVVRMVTTKVEQGQSFSCRPGGTSQGLYENSTSAWCAGKRAVCWRKSSIDRRATLGVDGAPEKEGQVGDVVPGSSSVSSLFQSRCS